MTDDDLLPFYFGAQKIEHRFGLSTGLARAKLRELCASGVVRSWKEPYSMVGRLPQGEGPPQVIEPSEWRQREIDLMTDADGCNYFVNVSNADLGHWLNRNGEGPVRDEQWTSFGEAAEEIEQEFGLSKAEAEVVLRQAIAEDRIRSNIPRLTLGAGARGAGATSPAEPIPPTPAEPKKGVELWVHLRDEGRWIKINRADLGRWLDEPAQQARRVGYAGKRPRIKSHLAKLYPDGVPDPAFCPRKELQRELVKLDRSLAPLDDATLKTAIDEYNADPKRSEMIRNRIASD